jgi:hypothetical protein
VKRSHALVLATTLALAAGVGQAAAAASPKRVSSPPRSMLARGKIGSAAPSAGAAARIRALGLDDDGGPGSDDEGGLTAGGHAAHGTIGSAGASPNAAARIAALGLDD